MTPRETLQTRFLARAGWGAEQATHLAGDASARRYTRLARPDGSTAILMDADPATGEDVRPFLRIARYLAAHGLSAPRILAADETQGFLLLEDLGDALFARLAADDPALEPTLYNAAIDLLLRLHQCPPAEGLTPCTPERMAGMLAPLFDHYLPALGDDLPGPRRQEITDAMQAALAVHANDNSVTILRDFHAENLIWLPDRDGAARVGLLDFQDAMAGHPAYDLVSLLQDARRDLAPGLAERMTERYIARSGWNRDRFLAACATLAVQRNLRILGIFARLATERGKPHYVDLVPRVWHHVDRTLAHPALADVAGLLRPHLRRPDPAALQRLKDRCQTAPTP